MADPQTSTTVQFPVSEQEALLLKTVFKSNDALLKLIRGLFFGFDLSAAEKEQIRTACGTPEIRLAIRKKIFPILDNDQALGTIADFWGGTEQSIMGASRDTIYQFVQAKAAVWSLLQQAMSLLEDPHGTQIDLTYDPKANIADDLQIKLIARNIYMKTVSQGLFFILATANQEVITPVEAAKRAHKNSSK